VLGATATHAKQIQEADAFRREAPSPPRPDPSWSRAHRSRVVAHVGRRRTRSRFAATVRPPLTHWERAGVRVNVKQAPAGSVPTEADCHARQLRGA